MPHPELKGEVARRRTFAIISHPDAGKTTLTEKLLLYGGAIRQAGSVKARKAARHATSDWMEIEKQRGISVTSSAMQFDYKGGFDGMMAQRNVMMKYGGYSKQEGKQSYFESMVKPILLSGEYSPSDLAGYISGYKRVLKVMWAEVGATDFPKTCTKFEVPFFIHSRIASRDVLLYQSTASSSNWTITVADTWSGDA